MSSTPSHSEESPRSHERRRFTRQRVLSLAYLDVGLDNGGIVLNLSEKGLAVQAVNPFFDKTRVSLRLQPPKSRKRIEASAEITWVSESKKEAGLQFLDLPEDARIEIADWVSAEADTDQHRWPNDLAPLKQVLSKPIAEESPCFQGKWSILLDDSAPAKTPANQKAPNPLPTSSIDRRNLESQVATPPAGRIPSNPANSVASSSRANRPPAKDGNDSRVRPQTSAEHISEMAGLPTPESPLPVAATSSPVLSSPIAADPIAKSTGNPNASVQGVNLAPQKFLAGRFRKWLAIVALGGCAASIFLFLGMAITRGLRSDFFGKSRPPESERVTSAASSTSITSGASSHGSASNLKTRRTDVSGANRATRMESPHEGNDENSRPSPQDSDITDPGAKFLLPIDPPHPTTDSDSQNASVPSLPLVAIQPSGAYDLAANQPPIDPPSSVNVERRSECYLLYRIEPLYPREAKEQHIEGTVTIHLLIGTDGRVRSLRALGGPGPLVSAALAAAHDWRFLPALLNGEPIDAEKDVDIAFRLPH